MRRLLALLAVLAASPLLAATYYVRTGGSDSNNCTDATTNACASVSRVVALYTLTGGDIVDVGPGTFYEQVTITPSDDGVSDVSRVTIRGAGPTSTYFTCLDATPLNDASFTNVSGNTYSASVTGRTILSVWEVGTNYTSSPIRVNDSTVTGAVYDVDTPYAYTPATTQAIVGTMSGSWFRSGDTLYVHTWNDVAPSASVNIETASRDRAIVFDGTTSNAVQYVTVRDLGVRYCRQGIYFDEADYIHLDNLDLYSFTANGISLAVDSNYSRLTDIKVRNVSERGDCPDNAATGACENYTGACDKNCGWVTQATGIGVGLSESSDEESTGHDWDGVEVRNCWGNFSIESVSASTFTDLFAINTPNHLLITNGFPLAPCDNIRIERSVFVNGQESGLYNSGCTNVHFSRNAGMTTFLADPGKSVPTGANYTSNLGVIDDNVSVCATCTTGFEAGYNWWPSTATCAYGGASYDCRDDGVGTDWPDACSCDPQPPGIANTTSVALNGVSWPVTFGLAASTLTRSAFYPVAGSVLIDAGDPDIDGDGIVELDQHLCVGGDNDGLPCEPFNGPSECPGTPTGLCTLFPGDDECNSANHCFGSAPDIGPFEYGIDSAAAQTCGNNSTEGTEVCDDGDTVTANCAYGDTAPLTQVCNATCTAFVDCLNPQYCGDGAINGPETCDGSNFGGVTCQSLGFAGGSLVCTGSCTRDTSGCQTVAQPSTISGAILSGGGVR